MAQDTAELLDVNEARHRLLAHFNPLECEEIFLKDAVGRIVCESILAPIPLPPFDNSSMDGFALRSAETTLAASDNPITFHVVADIPAGKPVDLQIAAGQAARIMTGAKIPLGADAVVPVEATDFTYRQAGIQAPDHVSIFQPLRPGENLRHTGDDLQIGDLILGNGHFIRPQDAGLLSMVGQARISVHRKPRVAIFSSGDELLPVEAELEPGKIHDANMYALIGLVERCGAEAVNLGIVADRPEDVLSVLLEAERQHADLIISSAGVSVGAMDFVRNVIEQEGRLEFWRVNMRPGKPFTFGYYHTTPFIGLPGNPVSAFVGFEVFVRPTLLKMQGRNDLFRQSIHVILLDDIFSDGRESYLRAVTTYQDGNYTARLTGHQGSGNLHSLVQANTLLLIPSGVKSVPSGGQVEAWLLDGSI